MNLLFTPQTFSFPGNRVYDPTWIFSHGGTEHPPENNEKAAYGTSPQAGKQLNIVMADDDEDDRELFKEALEKTGRDIHLQFAEDGKRLIDLLSGRATPPDLIFLDLNMPHKSGLECLTEIRNSALLKHVPVVIYSTSSSMKDVNDTYDHGANLYIRKPNSFSELQQISARVLQLNWNKYTPWNSRSHYLFSSKTE